MKKFYFLFSILILSNFTIAQRLSENGFPQAILKQEFKEKPINNKVPGTILYSEDFDSTGNAARNGLPQGWTLQNNAGNTFNWIWSNTAPGGQYSLNTPPLQSTTGSNGFLLLPSDFYNTPIPANGPAPIDASITSPQIVIPATRYVTIRFEYIYRFCCANVSELVAEVSNDGINWVTYDVKLNPSASFAPNNVVTAEFDVSSVLGNQTSAYVRFRQTNASWYYYMVDDLELIEGQAPDYMAIRDHEFEYGKNFVLQPNYTMMPGVMAYDISAFNVITESLVATQSNVKTSVEVIHESDCNGMPGQGQVYYQVDSSKTSIPAQSMDTFNLGGFNSFQTLAGKFRFNYQVVTDSTKPNNTLNKAVDSLIITDSTFARDNGIFTGSTGPSRYFGGGNAGDRMGVLYTTNSSITQSFQATTVSYYVANDSQNIGVGISPRIWEFDENQATLASAFSSPPIGSNPFTTTITSSDLGKWISISIFPPANLQDSSQYVVGFEQTTGASGTNFLLGRNISTESVSPTVTNFVYVNDATPAWGWISSVPGIRLHGFYGTVGGNSCQIVGQEELASKNESSLSIYPNPSNGEFALRLKTEKTKQYTLKVRNNLGQIILEEQVSANGNFAKAIDLSENEPGVYFLSLENEKERLIEKIIVQ